MAACRISLLLVLSVFGMTAALAQDRPVDQATLTGSGESIALNVDSGRPVLRAILTLEQRYGYVITYEDPSYTYSDDVFDATSQIRRDHRAAGPGIPRIMLPRAGKLSMQIPASACISPSKMNSILEQLVGLQGVASRGGHFQVQQTKSGIFLVIPTEVRDRSGNWTQYDSPLDARISFPAEPRTETELIAAIASSVSATTHLDVKSLIGNGIHIGPSGLNSFKFNIGADDETAREVLTRMLQASPRRQTWTLTNGVELSSNTYLLDVFALPPSACQTSVPAAPPVPHISGCMSCSGPPS